jgi:hypothetical protein
MKTTIRCGTCVLAAFFICSSAFGAAAERGVSALAKPRVTAATKCPYSLSSPPPSWLSLSIFPSGNTTLFRRPTGLPDLAGQR